LESIETSSLHLDLISDLKRINSHICSIAYPILEEAGVLARTRLKEPEPDIAPDDDPVPAPQDAKAGWPKHGPRTA
jgi:phosphate:Na+ symporter